MQMPTKITRAWGDIKLNTKKNSPHILFAGGIIGVVGGGILACRATLKLEPKLEQIQDDIAAIKEHKNLTESDDLPDGVEALSDIHYQREMGRAYARGAVSLARLYGPAAIIAGLGISLLTGSHIQLTHRNQALAAALTAMSQTYDEYRARVRDEIGEEKESDLYNNLVAMALEDADPDRGPYSIYACLFDEYNPNWTKDPELNMSFLRVHQAQFQGRLERNGHLFLNEVYDELGMDRKPIGQLVGWLWNSDGGDNFVDFGIFNPGNEEFAEGRERSVWLDFNVDGLIVNKI